MLAGILHLHRGTPYVYQGEELGMTNMSFGAISDYRDIEVLNHHREATTHLGHTDAEVLAALAPLNRDNARTPVQWDASRHAGFTTGAPWIAVNPNANHINAAAQVDDPDSVYSFYRQLIALRHAEPVVSHGTFTMLLPDDPHIYAFTRTLAGSSGAPGASSASPSDSTPAGGTELLILGNFSGEEHDAELTDEAWRDAELVLGNYPADGGTAGRSSAPSAVRGSSAAGSSSEGDSADGGAAAGAMRLRPWELRVLRRRREA
jgi:oligo-1,6-glucosidase